MASEAVPAWPFDALLDSSWMECGQLTNSHSGHLGDVHLPTLMLFCWTLVFFLSLWATVLASMQLRFVTATAVFLLITALVENKVHVHCGVETT